MRTSLFMRRYIFAVFASLMIFALLAGAWQINDAARAAMSESAVPMPEISGDGAVEYVFSGYGLSCLRSVAGKVFPYAALVLECLLWVFFNLVAACG